MGQEPGSGHYQGGRSLGGSGTCEAAGVKSRQKAGSWEFEGKGAWEGRVQFNKGLEGGGTGEGACAKEGTWELDKSMWGHEDGTGQGPGRVKVSGRVKKSGIGRAQLDRGL